MYPKLSIYGQISKIGLIVLGSLIAFWGAFGPPVWAGPAQEQAAVEVRTALKPPSRLLLSPRRPATHEKPVAMKLRDGLYVSNVNIWLPGSQRAISAARNVREAASSCDSARCLFVSAQREPGSQLSFQYVLKPGEFVPIHRQARLSDGRTFQTGVVVENSDQGVSVLGLGDLPLSVRHPPELVADVLPKLSDKELIISAASALVVAEKRVTSGHIFSADRRRRYRDEVPVDFYSVDYVSDLLSSTIKDDPNRLVWVIQSSESSRDLPWSLGDLLRKAHQREPGAPEEKISEGDRLLAVRLPGIWTGFVQPELLEKIAPVLDQIGRRPLHVVATDVAKILEATCRQNGTPVDEDIELALMYLGHEPYGL